MKDINNEYIHIILLYIFIQILSVNQVKKI